MAKQKGVIKLIGSVDDFTFIRKENGYYAQVKSSLDKAKFNSRDSFERTHETNSEFSIIAHAGKTFRDSVKLLTHRCADGKLSKRAMRLMGEIKKKDFVSARGLRNPAVALATPAVRNLLKGFEFNNRSHVSDLLFNQHVLDTATGTITLADLDVINEIILPPSATHVSFRSGWAKIDLENNLFTNSFSDAVHLERDAPPQTVELTLPEPDSTGSANELSIFVLRIGFSQLVNGVSYVLRDGEFNALGVIGVV